MAPSSRPEQEQLGKFHSGHVAMRWAAAIAVVAATACAAAACGSTSSTSTSTSASTAAQTSSSTATSSSSSAVASSLSASGTAKVVLTPTHGKVGTTVHVVGSGYAPNIQLTGTLCAVNTSGIVENPISDCDVLDVVAAVTDASGGFTSDYTVKRVPPPKAGYELGYGQVGSSAQSAGATFTVDP
jgi:hypothetical protein